MLTRLKAKNRSHRYRISILKILMISSPIDNKRDFGKLAALPHPMFMKVPPLERKGGSYEWIAAVNILITLRHYGLVIRFKPIITFLTSWSQLYQVQRKIRKGNK